MKTDIENSVLKKRMLVACIAKQHSLVNDFKKRIGALLVAEGLGNEESYDNNDLSNNSMRIDEANALNEALQFAKDEMTQLRYLEFLTEKTFTRVEQGAAVVTNSYKFFVSASIEQFQVDGETYIGLSVYSPLFLAMKGKTVGERFTYNGREYLIKEIY